jgi:hypothetical protein
MSKRRSQNDAAAEQRPSIFDPGILEAVCDRIMAGESVKAICRDPAMPDETEVYRAAAKSDEVRSSIAHAREVQQDAIVDQIVGMADAATVEDHQVVKLRIWARQWQASKLAPKKYGDAMRVDGNVSVSLADIAGAAAALRRAGDSETSE